MDLRFTDAEIAFRDEVRAFVDDNLPAEIRARLRAGRTPTREDIVRWTRILHAKGWSVPHWPAEHGGCNWTPVEEYIFGDEMQRAPAPPILPFGHNMVGPVIYTFGSEAQKTRFLPRIARLDDWWCQGFSEPGAGSDLASLSTAARREGDHYVVDGQKTWTTLGQHADWIFCLVRTDPAARKQAGISFLLVDMKTPGVTLRPIRLIDGGSEVNEVFFDAVRVPAENLVGEENRGWTYAKFLLGRERTGIARIGASKERLRRVRAIAAREVAGGRPLMENRRFRERLAAVEVELKALEMTQLRALSAGRAAPDAPDPMSSVLKLKGSELQQATTELLLEAIGPYALPFADPDGADDAALPIGPSDAGPIAPTYFNGRKVSIYGGSSEIQKSIVAKAILGL